MTGFKDQKGAVQQLDVTVSMYQEAQRAGMSLPAWLGTKYPTDEKRYGSIFGQLCEAEGIYVSSDRSLGIRSSNIADLIGGTSRDAAANVRDAVPTSRILFPAVTLQAIEDKLQTNLSMTENAFEQMLAIDESVNGERYEQPIINFDRAARARSQTIAQLAQPAAMMLITVSDKPFKIPTRSLGLEISHQALKITTLDFVALSTARQILVERNERAMGYLTSALNGDIDSGQGSLSAAGKVVTSTSLDSNATGGVLTQKAWMKYLMMSSQSRTLDILVTDIDGALAIENRTGRPTVQTDNGTSRRINTQMDVMNPLWPDQVKIFITVDPAWPANTIMGMDSRFALRRVKNVDAEYSAVEDFVIRRAQQLRVDHGDHVSRFYDDAWQVLTIS